MIHFDNICKRYPGGHDALNRINLRLPKGQMAFLTGHSGAGKSTLLKLIAMIERPTRGQIFLDGVNLNNMQPKNSIHQAQYRHHISKSPPALRPPGVR